MTSKPLEPEVHKHYELNNGLNYVEHLTHAHKPFCGCMNHKYLKSQDDFKPSDIKKYRITYTFVINDTFSVSNESWAGELQFRKLIANQRINIPNGHYGRENDPRKNFATNNIHFKGNSISFDWYDNIYKYGAHHMTIHSDYTPVQQQIDTYTYSSEMKADIPKVDFSKPYIFNCGGLSDNVIQMGGEQIESDKINRMYTWLPIISKLKEEVANIKISELTPQQIYDMLTKIFEKAEYRELFANIEKIAQLNILELGSTESEKDKRYIQGIVNYVHNKIFKSLDEEISDDDFLFIEDTYSLYRGADESKLINVNKYLNYRDDASLLKPLEDIEPMDTIDSKNEYNYVVTVGRSAFETNSLTCVRNYVRRKVGDGYKLISCETDYPSITNRLDEKELLFIKN